MRRAPVLQTGFRPFFLLAAVFAAVATPLWAAVLLGELAWSPALPGSVWHAHEMLVGFTGAVVAGFLLTAVRNWTGRPTLQGTGLGALAGVWLAGRALAASSVAPVWGLGADLLFFAGLAWGIGRPLAASRNVRNLGFVPLIGALGLLDVGVHLAPDLAPRLLRGLLDGMLVMVVVVAARIVPMFTRNALPSARVIRSPLLDRVALVGVLGAAVAEVLALPDPILAVSAGVAAVAVAVRATGWAPLATLRTPLLWVLHLGHLWVAAGLGLRAAVALGLAVPASAATHALAVGAIGTLTLGMMSRVALGHTGRPLVAPAPAVAAYALVTVAVLLRLTAAFGLSPQATLPLAAAVFGAAFALYAASYASILWRPRVDGRPG